MLAKEITKHPIGTVWAVADPGWSHSKEAKSSGNISRHRSMEVTIVDHAFYYTGQSWALDRNRMSKAPTSERAKGFLVSKENSNGDTIYKVFPSSEFIGLWADKEAEWSVIEAESAKRETEAKRQQQVIELASAQLNADIPVLKESVARAVKSLLGETASLYSDTYLRVDGDWADEEHTVWTPRLKGKVELQFTDFQRLLEIVYEARDALA